MRHATRVLRVHEAGSTTYTATCTCGWVGPDSDREPIARNEANKHELKGLKESRGKTEELADLTKKR